MLVSTQLRLPHGYHTFLHDLSDLLLLLRSHIPPTAPLCPPSCPRRAPPRDGPKAAEEERGREEGRAVPREGSLQQRVGPRSSRGAQWHCRWEQRERRQQPRGQCRAAPAPLPGPPRPVLLPASLQLLHPPSSPGLGEVDRGSDEGREGGREGGRGRRHDLYPPPCSLRPARVRRLDKRERGARGEGRGRGRGGGVRMLTWEAFGFHGRQLVTVSVLEPDQIPGGRRLGSNAGEGEARERGEAVVHAITAWFHASLYSPLLPPFLFLPSPLPDTHLQGGLEIERDVERFLPPVVGIFRRS